MEAQLRRVRCARIDAAEPQCIAAAA